MRVYSVFDDVIYFHEKYGLFSFSPTLPNDCSPLPPLEKALSSFRPTCYTFCLSIIDACNLSCDYCFNAKKSGSVMDLDAAIRCLETLFQYFPDGEKYIVDLSGRGEPLLALPTILKVADWCKNKQNILRKEVLVQFVSNGTLLNPSIVTVLQKRGILFGVSLDGNPFVHDKHRLSIGGQSSFVSILNKVIEIPNRGYVGCASTLTRDAFPLPESIERLIRVFRTISFRPARGKWRIEENSSKVWQREYERLAKILFEQALREDVSWFFALMNGDDWFGRFLCRAFGNQITMNRCDGGITRFSTDKTGIFFPCSAAIEPVFALSKNLRESSAEALKKQIKTCEGCPFKFICGGECPIEINELNHPNQALCQLTQRLIVLANWLEIKIQQDRPAFHERLSQFVDEKMARYRKDPLLEEFLRKNPGLTFTEGKEAFDGLTKRY